MRGTVAVSWGCRLLMFWKSQRKNGRSEVEAVATAAKQIETVNITSITVAAFWLVPIVQTFAQAAIYRIL